MPGEGEVYQYIPPGRSIISVLADEHAELTKLASSLAVKREPADRFTAALTRHLSAERQYLYPTVATLFPAQASDIANSEIEHDRTLLIDLALLRKEEPGDGAFRRLAQAVDTGLQRHIHTCETGMFPALEEGVTKADLVRLGNRVEVAQEAAPSRPHPRALMRPPWNKLTDAAIGAIDKIRDVASGRKTYPESSTASAAAKVVAGEAR
jgi:hemerythrin-like domain-containing protein